MATIVHMKQTMLPQYGRFQTLQTHVLQVMDKNKKMLLTREMLEKVLTLLIPNRVCFIGKTDVCGYETHCADVIDVETGDVESSKNLFDNENGVDEKFYDIWKPPYYTREGRVFILNDIHENQYEFHIKFLHSPLISSDVLNTLVDVEDSGKTTTFFSIEPTTLYETTDDRCFVTVSNPENTRELVMHKTINANGVTYSEDYRVATLPIPAGVPSYMKYIILRNSMIFFDVGCSFVVFDLEKETAKRIKKLNDIVWVESTMIQLLNGLVAVAGGHQLLIRDDDEFDYKYIYDITLYDPMTLQVVATKTFKEFDHTIQLPVLLHDGRVMFMNEYFAHRNIEQPRIFDPEDMSLTIQPTISFKKDANLEWIQSAQLLPFNPF